MCFVFIVFRLVVLFRGSFLPRALQEEEVFRRDAHIACTHVEHQTVFVVDIRAGNTDVVAVFVFERDGSAKGAQQLVFQLAPCLRIQDQLDVVRVEALVDHIGRVCPVCSTRRSSPCDCSIRVGGFLDFLRRRGACYGAGKEDGRKYTFSEAHDYYVLVTYPLEERGRLVILRSGRRSRARGSSSPRGPGHYPN